MGTRRRRRRLSQGRLFNRRSGRRAPRLYRGGQRRGAHRYFGTQASSYGAGGGGRSQVHVGHAGDARNVIRAGVRMAQSGRGMNMGLLPRQNPFRGSRQLKDYRRGLSAAKQSAKKASWGGRTRSDFGSNREYRSARLASNRAGSDAGRQYSETYRNPYTGTSHRRVTTGNVRSERTGRRTTMAIGFGGRGAGRSGLERIQARRQRSSARRGGQRLTGIPGVPGYRHANFSRRTAVDTTNRRYQHFTGGNRNFWNTGPNAGTILTPHWLGRRYMDRNERLRAQGRYGEVRYSDRRLKTDIKQVGTSPSGISVYQFRYTGNDLLYQGVLAQELLDTHREAVVTMPNGYYGVRYDLIDVDFVKVSGKELVSSA